MLNEDGTGFGSVVARSMLDRRRVEKLVRLGICRIDKVGKSTFAVFVGTSPS